MCKIIHKQSMEEEVILIRKLVVARIAIILILIINLYVIRLNLVIDVCHVMLIHVNNNQIYCIGSKA